MKKSIFFGLLLLLAPLGTLAFTASSEENVSVAAGESLEGSLYAASDVVAVDGTVNGDVICAAQTVNISGTVNGDVICAAQTVNISGTVDGNLRVAAGTVIVSGNVSRNIMAFADSLHIDKGAKAEGEMFISIYNGKLEGEIAKDVYGTANSILISGRIGGDVKIRADDADSKQPITIASQADIGGGLYYTARNKASIQEGAKISGEIKFNQMRNRPFIASLLFRLLFSVFSALAIALVLVSLARGPVEKITDIMLERAALSISLGAVSIFLIPLIALLLVFTIIGVPLAIMLMLFWGAALLAAKVLSGILIGRSLVDRLWPQKEKSLVWAMIIGIPAAWFLFSLPVLGWMFSFGALFWGMGGLWQYLKEIFNLNKQKI